MDRATAFECSACGRQVTSPEFHRCTAGAQLALVHDDERVREQFRPGGPIADQWRYAPLLPVEDAAAVSLGEGGTDLVDAPGLGGIIGVDLAVKLEGANPTGSTKDRGSSVVVSHASRCGTAVTCASTGNAAASLAAYAARDSLDCQLFVPDGVPEAKAVQPAIYGADVVTVDGGYDDAYDRCRAAAADRGWIDRSAGGSPYTDAGARTLGYELAEQTDGVPDWVVIPMGNGGTIAAAWSGLRTFADLGFADGTPRMLGVQASATSPIHSSVRKEPIETEPGETCADSIDVGTPHRAADACRAITESGGTSIAVSDAAIREATTELGRSEGVFVEPASAATVAAVEAAVASGIVDRGDDVVAVLTGNGLKDPTTARRALGASE